jgi:hypothetical protein
MKLWRYKMSIVNDVVRGILNKRLEFVSLEPDLEEIRGIQICPAIFEYEGVVERKGTVPDTNL